MTAKLHQAIFAGQGASVEILREPLAFAFKIVYQNTPTNGLKPSSAASPTFSPTTYLRITAHTRYAGTSTIFTGLRSLSRKGR